MTTALCALLATLAVGDAQDDARQLAVKLAAMKREGLECWERGINLFGTDPKRTDIAHRGTLSGKEPKDFQIGQWGMCSTIFKVVNKVNDKELLLIPRDVIGAEPVLLRGLDTSKVTDGAQFQIPRPVVIQETYSYVAVSQTKKTVLVFDADPAKVDKEFEKVKAAESKKNADKEAEIAKSKAKEEADRKAKKEAAAKFEPEAKKMMDDIKKSRYLPTVALKKLKELIEKYPDTDAAEEAQRIIDEKVNRSQPKPPIRRR